MNWIKCHFIIFASSLYHLVIAWNNRPLKPHYSKHYKVTLVCTVYTLRNQGSQCALREAVWHRQTPGQTPNLCSVKLPPTLIPDEVCQDAVGSLWRVPSSAGIPPWCGGYGLRLCDVTLLTRLSSLLFSMAPCHWWSLLSVRLMLS